MKLYQAVRRDARSWWYHAELRKRGQAGEARKREHATTRDHVARLRELKANGLPVILGRGSSYVKLPNGRSVSGLHSGNIEAARLFGLMVVDLRAESIEYATLVHLVMAGPMISADGEDDGVPMPDGRKAYSALGYAPAPEWVALHIQAGCPVENPSAAALALVGRVGLLADYPKNVAARACEGRTLSWCKGVA